MSSSSLARTVEAFPAVRTAPGILPKSRQQRKAKAQANARTPLAPVADQAVGGRYSDDAGKAIIPANGLAQARSRQQDVTVGAVQDPYDRQTKLAVSINRRIDLLEYEYSHRRLSHAAYTVGRELQSVFERASGRSASNWSQGDRVDAFSSKELQIISGLEKAGAVQAYMDRVICSVGQIGARFLRNVLSEGKTYTELAAMRGQSGEAGKAAAASRFRHLLEDLAEDWAAKGARH